jgi:hypothetical protein
MKNLGRIKEEHIREAARQIHKEGIPTGEKSRKYKVIVDDEGYPPPLIIRKAHKIANDHELRPFELSATEALALLKRLGFRIEHL